jgi:hypothetical protein
MKFSTVVYRGHDLGADLDEPAERDPDPGVRGEPGVIERAVLEKIGLDTHVQAEASPCLGLGGGGCRPNEKTYRYQTQDGFFHVYLQYKNLVLSPNSFSIPSRQFIITICQFLRYRFCRAMQDEIELKRIAD